MKAAGIVLVTALAGGGAAVPVAHAIAAHGDASSAAVADAARDAAPGAPDNPATVPFGPGERATYRVSLSRVGTVGHGEMHITGVQEIRGRRAYHIRFNIEGGVLFARVNDKFETWMDVSRLVSLRFVQNQHEVNYRRNRTFDFFPDEKRWVLDNGDTGELATTDPLDDVSFLYYVRTLPLEVGRTYTLHRYFREDGNPVVVRVLRKERVRVPAGTFDTIVVQPVIKTKGLFGEGGRAEVYFSDDERRILVQLRSRVPVVGSLNLHLQTYTPGSQLN
jgi:hypothetical protein